MASHTQEHAPRHAAVKDEVEIAFNLVGLTHRLRTDKVALAKDDPDNPDTSVYDGYAEALGKWLIAETAASIVVRDIVPPAPPAKAEDAA
jgi:hypothetical protein